MKTSLLVFLHVLLFSWFSSSGLAQDLLKTNEAKDQPAGEEPGVDDEIDNLQDADFPDLVPLDEQGELIDELKFLEEESMVESASRHRQKIGESPSAITVISREDIETSGAMDIPDLFRSIPGIDVVWINPSMSSISARLGWNVSNDNFLVLVDGREATADFLGQTPWIMQPIAIEDIERIEIIRGPGSAIYGPNALSGVVNITTRPVSDQPSGTVRISAGSAGNWNVGGRGSARFGDLRLSLNGGISTFGKFDDPRGKGFDRWWLRAVGEYPISNSQRWVSEFSLSYGSGPGTSAVGVMDSEVNIKVLRLSYESESLRGQLYWVHSPIIVRPQALLKLGTVTLAKMVPMDVDNHTIDGQILWTVPEFWKPLMIILGGQIRLGYIGCDQMLNEDLYNNPSSPSYHQPGFSRWMARAGGFVHLELSPLDWLTVNTTFRWDYNSETEEFFSPRLALVVEPAEDHYLRLGIGRSFRKPSLIESFGHLAVEFPPESPIQGKDQESFLEFMSRSLGNSELRNNELLSMEAGYQGQYFRKRLQLEISLFVSRQSNYIFLETNLVTNPQGLLDLEKSRVKLVNAGEEKADYFWGTELGLRFYLNQHVSFLASWTHREAFNESNPASALNHPKNLLALGGRFQLTSGLLGSIYCYTRSRFTIPGLPNPDGFLAPAIVQYSPDEVVLFARLGFKLAPWKNVELEIGAKGLLPISPFRAPYFSYGEVGSVITRMGERYGPDVLTRMILGYVQGTF